MQEVEAHHPDGCKPIALEGFPGIGYVVGVDLEATHLMMVLVDFSGHEIRGQEGVIKIKEGPQISDLLIELIGRTVRQCSLCAAFLSARIGVALLVPRSSAIERSFRLYRSQFMPWLKLNKRG